LLRSSQIPTLLLLVSEGAKDAWVPLTTVELAKKLQKSQQMASRHLEEMENEGLIERRRSSGKTYVKLTDKGAKEIAKIYSNLESVYGRNKRSVDIDGTVFAGLGEASYYVSQAGYKKQFVEKLGFEPYPGTLNLRLSTPLEREIRRELATEKGIHIEGFKDGKRTYGGAECFKSLLNDKVWCAVLVIERTSYDDSVLEIIAAENLREELELRDGDKVHVRIFLFNKSGLS
jgi:riboflavin kinase